MDKIIEKWDEILNTVKQEYEISDVSFDTWIRPLEVFAIEGNTLYILVPSEQMALSYISKKYLAPLRVAIVEITEIEYEIKFILPEEARTLKLNTKPAKATPAVTADESNLNPIIHLIHLSLVIITVLHIRLPLQSQNLREKHIIRFTFTAVRDLEKPTLCTRSDTLF